MQKDVIRCHVLVENDDWIKNVICVFPPPHPLLPISGKNVLVSGFLETFKRCFVKKLNTCKKPARKFAIKVFLINFLAKSGNSDYFSFFFKK